MTLAMSREAIATRVPAKGIVNWMKSGQIQTRIKVPGILHA
jgi:hypothetical protein